MLTIKMSIIVHWALYHINSVCVEVYMKTSTHLA